MTHDTVQPRRTHNHGVPWAPSEIKNFYKFGDTSEFYLLEKD